jgi:hypothetical protein
VALSQRYRARRKYLGIVRLLRMYPVEEMNQRKVVATRRHKQMLNYMSLIQSDLRERPECADLQSEAAVDRLSGQPWGPTSVCDSRWTLRGPRGTIEVRAVVDYDREGKLLTTVTCASSKFPFGPIEQHFGEERQSPSTLGSVMPVLTDFLQVITRGNHEPFADVVMPRVP